MHCSGCGKHIPFGGAVCPFCQRDKSSDQTIHIAGVVGMCIGGTVGSWIGGFGGMVVGAIVIGFLVVIIGAASGGHSAKKPPRVRIDRNEPAVASVAGAKASKMNLPNDPATRLERLNALRDQGAITEDEYKERRTVIIAAL